MLIEKKLELFVKDLRGQMPENVRAAVAEAIVEALMFGIDSETEGWYEHYGRREFLEGCEVI